KQTRSASHCGRCTPPLQLGAAPPPEPARALVGRAARLWALVRYAFSGSLAFETAGHPPKLAAPPGRLKRQRRVRGMPTSPPLLVDDAGSWRGDNRRPLPLDIVVVSAYDRCLRCGESSLGEFGPPSWTKPTDNNAAGTSSCYPGRLVFRGQPGYCVPASKASSRRSFFFFLPGHLAGRRSSNVLTLSVSWPSKADGLSVATAPASVASRRVAVGICFIVDRISDFDLVGARRTEILYRVSLCLANPDRRQEVFLLQRLQAGPQAAETAEAKRTTAACTTTRQWPSCRQPQRPAANEDLSNPRYLSADGSPQPGGTVHLFPTAT
uniref:F5/8 type C domain-containing protein n=1 Tax=Macrostomum lignano TaxID=282301 RepID=A0A1I8JP47_9PLAT